MPLGVDDTLAVRLQAVSIQFVPFLMAVVFHEYGHGWMAKRFGDKTAEEQGRLTLNPVAHVDPIGTVLFPLINMLSGMNLLFGWARPVPIDPRRFKKFRPGLFWVSLAGPGMNFLLAMVSAIVFVVLKRYVSPTFYLLEPLTGMALVSVSINCALGIFNLIPLPPLDGSKIIESFLSYSAMQKYEGVAQYSFWILLFLLMSGALSILHGPIEFLSMAALKSAFFLTELLSGGAA